MGTPARCNAAVSFNKTSITIRKPSASSAASPFLLICTFSSGATLAALGSKDSIGMFIGRSINSSTASVGSIMVACSLKNFKAETMLRPFRLIVTGGLFRLRFGKKPVST